MSISLRVLILSHHYQFIYFIRNNNCRYFLIQNIIWDHYTYHYTLQYTSNTIHLQNRKFLKYSYGCKKTQGFKNMWKSNKLIII